MVEFARGRAGPQRVRYAGRGGRSARARAAVRRAHALTRGASEKYKRQAAVWGSAFGAGILFLFAFIGDALLGALSIGLPAFRIAGGALLFLLAVDVIFARPSGMRASAVEDQERDSYTNDISVFPLAIPLIAGPGALTTVLLYTGGGGAVETAAVMAVLALVLLPTLLSLLLAPRIMDVFGEAGSNVLSRVLGVILAALAVQFVLDGVHASFPR